VKKSLKKISRRSFLKKAALGAGVAAGTVQSAMSAHKAREKSRVVKPVEEPYRMRIETLRCEYLLNPTGIDTPQPRLSWVLLSGERAQKQTAFRVLVATSASLLEKDQGDIWDSGKILSENQELVYGGKQLSSRRRCYWKVKVWDRNGRKSDWSGIASWEMGLLQPEDWKASWIGMDPSEGRAGYPWLRKTFVLDDPSGGRAYITSLGWHELYVNGEKVGDDVLSPAVTQFDRRALYLTHDITRLLRKGTNCLAIWLGYGWYHEGRPGFPHVQRPGGPVVCAQIELQERNGKTVIIGTDDTWKAYSSPISKLEDNPWCWSLAYNAQLEQPGWNLAEFDDRQWIPAQECDISVPNVCAQMVQPNKIIRVLPAVKIEPSGQDTWLVDMGTNLTGWFNILLPDLQAGQKVKFDYYDCRPDLVLEAFEPRVASGLKFGFDYFDRSKDFKVQPVNATGKDEYIASGKGRESFCNRFNYQGFRYVRIAGLSSPPALENISAFLVDTDYESGSSFSCSNKRLSAIHDMVSYTFRCLTLGGYMVDCPHIERLGYGLDSHVSLESALMMHELGPLYRSWLAAWRDCQEPDGDMPHTAPSYLSGGGPFGCAFIIGASWFVFRQYGDRSILSENYPAMQKWLGFMEKHTVNGDIFEPWPNSYRRNWFLGDWATPRGIDQSYLPSVLLINNCLRIYYYDLMTQAAAALDYLDDAKRYREKAEALRPVVHNAFYNTATGTYADGDQIDLALPLLTGIVPAEHREEILNRLEQDILKRKGHIGFGLMGTWALVKLLIALDRNDLIFTLANHDSYPGWGYMLKNGATTTWEHWDGLRSHIHNCYNGIGVWFYQGLAGIRPDTANPGFRHFHVRPAVVGDIIWAKATYLSWRGSIVSNWQIADDRLEMTVDVPVGATATVWLPVSETSGITESGKPVGEATGVRYLHREDGGVVYEVESGTYLFSGKLLESNTSAGR